MRTRFPEPSSRRGLQSPHRTRSWIVLETVYETALEWELVSMGLAVRRQQPIPLVYRDQKLEDGFRADLVVEGKVIVEIKSLDIVPTVAYKILLTYASARFDMRLGVLINFNEEHLKDGIKRVVNKLDR